jgi:hypothetical protein
MSPNISSPVFRRSRKIAKSDCQPHYGCLSFRPHETALLPVDGFSQNLIYEYFSKKSVEKFEVSITSYMYNGTLHEVSIASCMYNGTLHEVSIASCMYKWFLKRGEETSKSAGK